MTSILAEEILVMCAKLGIENIIVCRLKKKRNNIRKRSMWLKKLHLGMVNIFTAGDKHFYKYIDDVKKETNINLIYGDIVHLRLHFKSGFRVSTRF